MQSIKKPQEIVKLKVRQHFTALPNHLIEKTLPLLTTNARTLLLVLYRNTIGWDNRRWKVSPAQLRGRLRTEGKVKDGKVSYSTMTREMIYKARKECEILGVFNSPYALFTLKYLKKQWIVAPIDPFFNTQVERVEKIQSKFAQPETQAALQDVKKSRKKARPPAKKPLKIPFTNDVELPFPGVEIPTNGKPAVIPLEEQQRQLREEAKQQKQRQPEATFSPAKRRRMKLQAIGKAGKNGQSNNRQVTPPVEQKRKYTIETKEEVKELLTMTGEMLKLEYEKQQQRHEKLNMAGKLLKQNYPNFYEDYLSVLDELDVFVKIDKDPDIPSDPTLIPSA